MPWTPDGRGLAYIDNREGVSNIWSQPLGGSKQIGLTDFKTDRIFWFGWSRYGKQLGLARAALFYTAGTNRARAMVPFELRTSEVR